MTEFPCIRIGNKPFYRVSCRKCGTSSLDKPDWKFFSSEDGQFRALHVCGHVSTLQIVEKPDPKGHDMRFFQ